MTVGSGTSEGRRKLGRPSGIAAGGGRAALLAAARAQLRERGPGRVTLREVAKRAGVQPTLASYYFGGKSEMFGAVIVEVPGEWLARAEQILREYAGVDDFTHALAKGLRRKGGRPPAQWHHRARRE